MEALKTALEGTYAIIGDERCKVFSLTPLLFCLFLFTVLSSFFYYYKENLILLCYFVFVFYSFGLLWN